MRTITPEKQFANDVNAAFPLPDFDSESYRGIVRGDLRKTYFERSPYASIEVYSVGFIVWNHVVGVPYEVRTYAEAACLRAQFSNRYKTISSGCRYN